MFTLAHIDMYLLPFLPPQCFDLLSFENVYKHKDNFVIIEYMSLILFIT